MLELVEKIKNGGQPTDVQIFCAAREVMVDLSHEKENEGWEELAERAFLATLSGGELVISAEDLDSAVILNVNVYGETEPIVYMVWSGIQRRGFASMTTLLGFAGMDPASVWNDWGGPKS